MGHFIFFQTLCFFPQQFFAKQFIALCTELKGIVHTFASALAEKQGSVDSLLHGGIAACASQKPLGDIYYCCLH